MTLRPPRFARDRRSIGWSTAQALAVFLPTTLILVLLGVLITPAHDWLLLLRRLRWAFLAGAGLGSLLVLLGSLLSDVPIHLGWVSAQVGYVAGALFAFDGARSLGHCITGRYLVTRHRSVKRRTVALRRDGVIGWKVTQRAWHRRSCLCRLTATTAGGRGAYDVKDVLMPEGLRFTDASVPGALEPFVTCREVPA